MKRAILFVLVVAAAAVALYYSQKRTEPTSVTPALVLNMVADAQRDMSRAPMQLTRLSNEDEIRIGNELAARYTGAAEGFTDLQKALQAYVQRVGGTVSLHAHRRLPYQFHLLPQKQLLNAFALPGGHVFVGEGMLDLMLREDELANVLAHEIEHIDHYHCAERVQIEGHLRKLRLGIVGELVQIPMSVWQIGYNKDQEAEADREGILLAVQSGYSPFGAVTMFERFGRLHEEYVIHARTPQQELSQLAVQGMVGYFRSHPLPSERIAQANRLIAQQRWQDRNRQKPFHVEYQVHTGRRSASARDQE